MHIYMPSKNVLLFEIENRNPNSVFIFKQTDKLVFNGEISRQFFHTPETIVVNMVIF